MQLGRCATVKRRVFGQSLVRPLLSHKRRDFIDFMRFIILTLFLLCQSFALLSQTVTSLRGIVTDPVGAVVPNAQVSATLLNRSELNKSQNFATATDGEGKFIFENLPAGEYKLIVSAIGFGSETERQISLPQNKIIEIYIGLGCDRLSEGSGVATDEDKVQIARLAFVDAVGAGSGLLTSEQRNKSVIVSTENIKPEWLIGVTDLKLKFMTQSQIRQKANREGDFLYVSFPHFKFKGMCVALEVANSWAVGKNSRFVYLSGGGSRYEFRKESGKWVQKSIGGWIS